jgi:hypothetical protein
LLRTVSTPALAVGTGPIIWMYRQRARTTFDWIIRHAIPISFIIQLGLIGFGEYQDRHSDVKYTDVDYRVFSDAVRCLWTGCSRGEEGKAAGVVNAWTGGGIGE